MNRQKTIKGECYMKDLTYEVSNEVFNHMLELAIKHDYNYFIIEGTLADSLMIVGNDRLRVGRAKPRKYIIIECIHTTTRTSELVMTMTDDDEKADMFYKEWESIHQDQV